MPHRTLSLKPLAFMGLLVALVALPRLSPAQQQIHPRWEIPGFDFSPDGVWRGRARQVARSRVRMLFGRDFIGLNAPLQVGAPALSAPAVSGTLLVPAILLRYKDTNLGALRDTGQYTAVLFGATAPSGRHYTVRTFYEELSRGLFSMQGRVFGWAALDSNEVTYTGQPGTCSGNPFGTTNCNGLFSSAAISQMQTGMVQALQQMDQRHVDWGQFDNDGPDGIPNSGDDDGYVDMAIFVHPNMDGACGGAANNHIWSHRYVLQTPYVTATPAHNGGFIKVRDYTFQSGVGGSTACDSTQIMPVGTAAHESGHGLDLPDLYDLSFVTEGIGEWGLMGSGNYTSPLSPSRMEAWSLGELGWVTIVPLTASGAYTLGPAPTADSAFLVRPSGTSNPRGEYFLIENRQAVGADTALIRIHCARSGNPPGCGGGLLVWHVDSVIAATSGFRQGNQMNANSIHGLALLEADGFGNLDANPNTSSCAGLPTANCSNRGDAGDPYPGTGGNHTIASSSRPSDVLNAGTCAGFRLDSITPVAPNGPVRFVLSLGVSDSVAITTPPQLASGQWGYSYGLALGAACGNGSFAWVVDSGAPPPGMALAAYGVLNGAPTDTGSYGFTAKVTSGSYSARRAFTVRVNEPVLTLQQVLSVGFQGPAGTGDNVRRYLDLQGNNSGTFDLGDVLRWLERTGNVPAATAMARAASARRRP
jgi:M6 family metalloprotease-like protein